MVGVAVYGPGGDLPHAKRIREERYRRLVELSPNKISVLSEETVFFETYQ